MEIAQVTEKDIVRKSSEILKRGGVIICPTDTVYGFLADATNKKAVEKIFRIKKRLRSKPLAVFVKDLKMAKELAEISKKQEKILKKYWFTRPKPAGGGGPGKYTFVLDRKPIDIGSRTVLYGVGKKTIALRIPKYKFLNDLLKKINKPLAQTSVNISGNPPITKIEEIKKRFGSKPGLDLIIDEGDLKKSKPSKIIDLTVKVLTRLR